MEKGNSKEEEDNNYPQANAAMSNSCKLENSPDEHESGSVLQTFLLPKNESRKTNKWTAKEDMLLKELVSTYGEKSWRKISSTMNNRSAIQCLHRWSKILKPGLVKGPWTSDEDQKLMQWVSSNGSMKWSECSSVITGRSGKQCRERWFNNLNPDVKKGNWTEFEDNAIFQGYFEHGSSWSRIAKELEGRTENSVKNRFYSTVRKLISDLEKQQTNIDTTNSYHPCNTGNSQMIAQQSQQPMSNGTEGASNIAYSNQRIVEVLRSITNDSKFCKKEKLISSEKDDQSNAGLASTADGKHIVRANEELVCRDSEDEVKQQVQLEQNNNSESKISSSKMHSSNGQNIKNNSMLQASKQVGQEYSEQNYLYRLILNGNVNIKKTASMQDYAMLQKNKLKGSSELVSTEKEKKIHKGKVTEQDQQSLHSQEPKKKIKKTLDNRSNELGEQLQQVMGNQVNRQQGQGCQSGRNEKQKDQLGRDSSQMERESNKLAGGGQKQQRQQDQLLFESLKRKLNNNCEKQEDIKEEEEEEDEEEEDNSDEGEDDDEEDEDDDEEEEDDDNYDEGEMSEQFSEQISKAMSVSLAKFMKSKLAKLARSITQNYSKQRRGQTSSTQATKSQYEAENIPSRDRKKSSQNMASTIDQRMSDQTVLKSKKSYDKIEKNEAKRIDQQKKSQLANSSIVCDKNNQEIQPRQRTIREDSQGNNHELSSQLLKSKLDKEEQKKLQQQQQQQQQQSQLQQQQEIVQAQKKLEEAAESQRKSEYSFREQQQQLLMQQHQQKQQQQLAQQEQLLQQQKQQFLQSLSISNGNAAAATVTATNAPDSTEEGRGEGRIDFLISQLNSLMSLLNTTKNELNKLESSQKQPTPLPQSAGWVRSSTENQPKDTTKHVFPFAVHGQLSQPKQQVQLIKQTSQSSQGRKEVSMVDYPQMKQPYKLGDPHQLSLPANPLNTQNNTDYFDSSYSLPFLEMDQFSGLFNTTNNNHINSNQHEEFMKQEHPAGVPAAAGSSPFRKSNNTRSREFLSPSNQFGQESAIQQNEEKIDGFQSKQLLEQMNEIHN